MKKNIHLALASASFLLLANFSQDSSNGNNKPVVNFYGTITDGSDKSFKAENITLERLYKQVPVYQVAPSSVAPETYDPSVNITLLDLAEIDKVTVDVNQKSQKYRNRDYITICVYSKMPSDSSESQIKNEYIIESNKKLTCEEVNPAGPIKKEIMMSAVKTIQLEGYKQNNSDQDSKNKPKKTASSTYNSKRKGFLLYVQNLFS